MSKTGVSLISVSDYTFKKKKTNPTTFGVSRRDFVCVS